MSPFPVRKPLVPAGERTHRCSTSVSPPCRVSRSGHRGKSRWGESKFSSLRRSKDAVHDCKRWRGNNEGFLYTIGDRLIRINSSLTWLLVAWLTRFKVSFLKDILKRSFLPLYVHSNGEILRDFKIVHVYKGTNFVYNGGSNRFERRMLRLWLYRLLIPLIFPFHAISFLLFFDSHLKFSISTPFCIHVYIYRV